MFNLSNSLIVSTDLFSLMFSRESQDYGHYLKILGIEFFLLKSMVNLSTVKCFFICMIFLSMNFFLQESRPQPPPPTKKSLGPHVNFNYDVVDVVLENFA